MPSVRGDGMEDPPTEIMWAKLRIGRYKMENLLSLAGLINVPGYTELNEEDLRKAITKRQDEILAAYGLNRNPGWPK